MDSEDKRELSAYEAARNLNMRLPGKDPFYWRNVLANSRKSGRTVAERIPFTRKKRLVFYKMADINKFVEHWKSTQKDREARHAPPDIPKQIHKTAAFKWAVEGRHAPQGQSESLRLKVMGLSLALPLTPTQARALAAELVRFADKLDPPER